MLFRTTQILWIPTFDLKLRVMSLADNQRFRYMPIPELWHGHIFKCLHFNYLHNTIKHLRQSEFCALRSHSVSAFSRMCYGAMSLAVYAPAGGRSSGVAEKARLLAAWWRRVGIEAPLDAAKERLLPPPSPLTRRHAFGDDALWDAASGTKLPFGVPVTAPGCCSGVKVPRITPRRQKSVWQYAPEHIITFRFAP